MALRFKQILIAGIGAGLAMAIASAIAGALVQLVFPYDVLTLGGMRSVTDPIMLGFFLYPWVLAFVMAIAYCLTGKALDGTWIQKGQKFGLVVWLVAGIPSAYVVFTSMDYPIGFTVNQLVGGLLVMLAGALVIARLEDTLC